METVNRILQQKMTARLAPNKAAPAMMKSEAISFLTSICGI